MLRKIRKALGYKKLFTEGSVNHKVFLAESDEHLAEAQRLHAEIYIERGYIAATDLGADLRMHIQADPHQQNSRYFVVTQDDKAGKVVATARQIQAVKEHGHASFPTFSKLKLYPTIRAEIELLNPAHCVEISGLAKAHGASSAAVLMLYRAMWQYSLVNGHRIWLMSVDKVAYSRLRFLFGNALVRIGNDTHYMGSDVVPAMLEVGRSIAPLVRSSRTFNPIERVMKREMVTFLLDGLPEKYLTVAKNPISAFTALTKDGEAK